MGRVPGCLRGHDPGNRDKVCPWYVVPADEKWFARALVSDILLKTLKDLDPKYPKLSEEQKAMLEKCKIN